MSDLMEDLRPVTAEKTNANRLALLERKIKGKLPDAYRQFLLRFNGGKPARRLFRFIERGHESTAAIRYLFADCSNSLYGIEAQLDLYAGRIPDHCLPIGCDSFGNLILLSVRTEDHGSIHFWDHESELSRPGSWNNVYKMAPGFNEFVASLMESGKETMGS